MNANYNKIVIVSLYENISSEVAQSLSEDLGMMFCSAKDMLEYELMDEKQLSSKISVDYLKKQEKKVIKQIASFENICVSISYELFIVNYDVFKESSLVVFLDLPKRYIKKNCIPSFLDFADRREKLNQLSNCTIVVHRVEKNNIKNKIIKALRGML